MTRQPPPICQIGLPSAELRQTVLMLLPLLLQSGESFAGIVRPLPLQIDAEIAFPAIYSFLMKKHALAGESPIEECERILRRSA